MSQGISLQMKFVSRHLVKGPPRGTLGAPEEEKMESRSRPNARRRQRAALAMATKGSQGIGQSLRVGSKAEGWSVMCWRAWRNSSLEGMGGVAEREGATFYELAGCWCSAIRALGARVGKFSGCFCGDDLGSRMLLPHPRLPFVVSVDSSK